MKLSNLFAGVAMAAAFAVGSTAAQAAVVNFDDPAANAIVDLAQSTFDDQGLTFTSSGTFMYVWDGGSPNGNGTNANIFAGFNTGEFETITKTGGGTFDLNSIDMAVSWYDPNSTETISVNGSSLTITSTLTTYNFNLHGVSSVTISGVPSNSGYWLADNINYSAGGVPEPATWAMMLVGFGGLGAMMRSRRQAAVAA